MLEVYRKSSIDWKRSPVVALATGVDDSQVAAAREDGSLEIWLVSPGSVDWHHHIVVEIGSLEVVHRFTPFQEIKDEELPPNEPPIRKMFTSSDGLWLAAINCLGDICIFNLELLRQHWFISRLDGASVTAGGFPQWNKNVLVVTTSSNQIYAFDVEAKKLGDWSLGYSDALPKRFQEFPGEVFGLSFPHSTSTSAVIVYCSRAMCLVDFG